MPTTSRRLSLRALATMAASPESKATADGSATAVHDRRTQSRRVSVRALATMASWSESTATADDASVTTLVSLYGQNPQPEETPEFLSRTHAALLEELEKLPDSKKAGWSQAEEKCPDLVGEDFRLMFLRCEVFNAELAALRIGKYWDRRIELFGARRAFQPIHLSGEGGLSSAQSSSEDADIIKDEAMVRHTLKGLHLGFIRPTQTCDAGGRAILFSDPSRLAGYDKSSNDERMGVARALWYVMHNAIEGNDTVQKLGITVIVFPRNAKISVIDRKLTRFNIESVSGCLPIRVGGFHICHPPQFFAKIIYPILNMVMPARMRRRMRVHSGSDEEVLENLKEFGLGRDVLPTEIGGDVILDTDSWMQEMKSRGL